MSRRGGDLNDSSPETWEISDPDALLMIADDDWSSVDRELQRLITSPLPACIAARREERGQEIGEDKVRKEPFGFRDGITNPEFAGRIPADWSNDNVLQPLFPLRHVLVEYPKGIGGTKGYGSFFVFRKLEQDTGRFEQLLTQLATQLNPPKLDLAERAVVGRDRQGNVAAQGGKAPGKEFAWAEVDRFGDSCPFHAHIRRANPRGESGEGAEKERAHLIVRRGMPYSADSRVGTLFICCQSDIRNQFEYVQGKWINADWGRGTNQDPLAGQRPRIEQDWPKTPGKSDRVRFTFNSCITLKGGEYFFAPPITFLRNL
jgi:Dyp-type peroxidase family